MLHREPGLGSCPHCRAHRSVQFVAAVVAAIVAAFGLSGCDPARSTRDNSVGLTTCRPPGVTMSAVCGKLEVPEDPETPGGRKIALNVMVIPALKAGPEDPVFFLAGGPGQAATELAGSVLPALVHLQRTRDLVFVDQRGTGESNPLDCDLYDDSLQSRFEDEFPIDRITACAKAVKETAAPEHYLSDNASDDLDLVRTALGYDKINLIGVSYGTRLALVYARRHPTHLRSMVLDGVAPPKLRLFLDSIADGQRALDLLFEQCEAAEECNRAFPNARKQFDALLKQLDDEPRTITVRHPSTGKPTELRITRDVVTGSIQGLLYSSQLSQLAPMMMKQMFEGQWDTFVAQALVRSEGAEKSMSVGLFLSIACAEDLPRVTDKDRDEAAAKSFLGGRSIDEVRRVCAIWPHGTVDPSHSEPVESKTPTLLLSGALDPVTPPHWAEEAKSHLPNGRHVIAPNVGHGVMFGLRCAHEVLQKFVDAAAVTDLDTSCLEDKARPPFFIDPLGPAP